MGGQDASNAEGISGNGAAVVGWSDAAAGQRAFYWTPTLGMQNLNDLLNSSAAGWTLTEAIDVSDSGHIIGRGINPFGQAESFLLTPLDSSSDLTLDPLDPVTATGGPQDLLVVGRNFAADAAVDLDELGDGLPPYADRTILDRGTYADGRQWLLLRPNFGTTAATWAVTVRNVAAATSATREFQVQTPPLPAEVPAEVLARRAVYKNGWVVGDNLHDDAEFANFDGLDYTVSKIFSDPATGFYGLGLLSPTAGPAVVLRGTEDILDFVSDADYRGVGYDQFLAGWDAVRQWVGLQPSPVDVVGHSLGGALAQWFGSALTKAGTAIDELITFNSPGISTAAANSFVHSLARDVEHYVVNGDLVSLAGEKFVPGDVHLASFNVLTRTFDFVPLGAVASIPQIINWKHLRPLTVDYLQTRGVRPAGLAFRDITTAQLNRTDFKFADTDFDVMLSNMNLALGLATAGASFLGLPLTAAALQGAKLVPASLAAGRGPTEAARKSIGTAVEIARRSVNFVREAADVVRVQVDQRLGDFGELTKLRFNPLTLDVTTSGNPPTLRAVGDFGVTLGEDISIRIPLYGEVSADHLLELVRGSVTTTVSQDRVKSQGEIRLLDGLISADGAMTLYTRSNAATITGRIDLADGVVSGSGSIDVNSDRSLVVRAAGQIRVPSGVPIYGGRTIAGGGAYTSLSFDGDFTNDSLVQYWDSPTLGSISLFYSLSSVFGIPVPNVPYPQFGKSIDVYRPQFRGLAAAQAAGPSGGQEQFVAPEQGYMTFSASWAEGENGEVELVTPSGQVLTAADWAADPGIHSESFGNGTAVRVDAPEQGIWTVRVKNATPGDELQIRAFGEYDEPTAFVTGVTGGSFRNDVSLGYAVSGVTTPGTVLRLFAEGSGDNADLRFLIDERVLDGNASGSFAWNVANVPAGDYELVLETDVGDGRPKPAASRGTVTVSERPVTVARRVLYTPGVVAPDKAALLPGQKASFANYTSYSGGLRYVAVDVADLPAGTALSGADFAFRVGNSDNPGTWASAPAPSSVTVLRGGGEGGSDRVLLTWSAAGAVKKAWLQVTVLPTAATGLAAADVFYFGNAPGESGNDPANAVVNLGDVLLTRQNQSGFATVGADNRYDFNRDGRVNLSDVLIARTNQSGFSPLRLIDLRGGGGGGAALRIAGGGSGSSGAAGTGGGVARSLFAAGSGASGGLFGTNPIDGGGSDDDGFVLLN